METKKTTNEVVEVEATIVEDSSEVNRTVIDEKPNRTKKEKKSKKKISKSVANGCHAVGEFLEDDEKMDRVKGILKKIGAGVVLAGVTIGGLVMAGSNLSKDDDPSDDEDDNTNYITDGDSYSCDYEEDTDYCEQVEYETEMEETD